MVLRVGTQIVGVRAGTDDTARTLRDVFAAWHEPDVRDANGLPIVGCFSVRLESERTGRGPRSVPQLRYGSRLLARSRHAGDVVAALDGVLGGVLASQDHDGVWCGLRTFVADARAVLVEATPPALTADPALRSDGIVELPTWSVVVDADTVRVPPPLTAMVHEVDRRTMWADYRLAGLVAIDDCQHDSDDAATDDHGADGSDGAGHDAIHDPTNPARLLARFASRQPSSDWFLAVERLVAEGRVEVAASRADAAQHVRALLAG